MKLLKAYQYLFYKLYKFYESSTYSKWWSDWKAIGSILVLEMFALKVFVVFWYYYTGYPFKTTTNLLEPYEIIIIAVTIIMIYYLFDYNDKWKDIVKDFDNLPRQKNKIGSIFVLGFIIIILVAYWYFAINFMSKLNYEQ